MRFEREWRYVILKVDDILKALNRAEGQQLADLMQKVDDWRTTNGKPLLEAVCVEQDWPEYELVWEMIKTRTEDES